MSRMRRVAPDLVPEPLASGSFSSVPDVHFLLCEFRRMTGTVPVPEALAAKIAELHRCSGGGSGGKFGSDVPTFHGNVRVDHGWSGSWEEYFARTTKVLFGLEQEAQVRQFITWLWATRRVYRDTQHMSSQDSQLAPVYLLARHMCRDQTRR